MYLLSIEIERLLVRGTTVSLLSLVIVGREDEEDDEEEEEEEEDKMAVGELSFTESEGKISRRRIQ